MYEAARDAGVVHMTAFTYRFAPSMRYLRHLRQVGSAGHASPFSLAALSRLARDELGLAAVPGAGGAGDLFDMTIHRIDFAIDLLGPIAQVCGAVARFAPRDRTVDGKPCPPSDVDDWSSLDRRVRQWRDRRLGRNDAGQGLSPRRLRPRMGRDQRLGGLGRLPPARAEHDPAGQDRPRPGSRRRSRPSS